MGYWGESGTAVTWSNPDFVPESQRQSGGWYYNPDTNRVDRWWSGSAPSTSSGSSSGGGGAISKALEEANRRAAENEARLRAAEEERQRELERQRQERERLFKQFTGEEQGLQTKLEQAIAGFESPEAIRSRLGTELGIDIGELNKQSELLRNTLEAIPENVARIAANFPLTGGARDRRIAAQVAEIAPEATRAQENLQTGVGLISNFTSEALSEQRFNKLTPIQQEFETLKDRIAREISGFDTQNQNELNALIDKINTSGSLLDSELNRATELAMKEEEFLREQWNIENNARQIIDRDGRQVLINPYTGETIADLGSSSTGGGGGESDIWISQPPTGETGGETETTTEATTAGGGSTETTGVPELQPENRAMFMYDPSQGFIPNPNYMPPVQATSTDIGPIEGDQRFDGGYLFEFRNGRWVLMGAAQ